jgi:hypothetical protein
MVDRCRFLFAFCTLLIFALGGVSQVADAPLPVLVQYNLLRKVLSFDRKLISRSRTEIVLGIVYVPEAVYSLDVKGQLAKIVLEAKPADIEGLSVRPVPIEFTTPLDFGKALDSSGVNLLYIAPVAEKDVRTIVQACASRKIPTVAGLGPYIYAGVAVVFRQEHGRPDIFINLHACQAQGFEFSARLLHLARIVDPGGRRSGLRP